MKRYMIAVAFAAALFIFGCADYDREPDAGIHVDAGDDRAVNVSETATLDGTRSFVPEGHEIRYTWALDSAPDGSLSVLMDADTVYPYFLVDTEGRYVISLIISDGINTSDPDYVTVTATDVRYEGMRYIRAGTFYMGNDEGNMNESPLHAVALDDYFIDIYEVTVADYRSCADAFYCMPPDKNSSVSREHYFDSTTYDNYPIVNVTHYDAKRYCEYMGKTLPTEAMWEMAARGDTRYLYPWGNDIITTAANYDNTAGDTTLVNRYASGASVYSVYNMSGNVAEWVADYYDDDYYENSPASNPTGPVAGSYYVVRGGHFASNQFDIRIVSRSYFSTEEASDYIGFRCAKTP